MAPTDLQLLTTEIVDAPVPIVRVGGELDLSTAAQLCRAIHTAATDAALRPPRVVVDLTELEFCDSTGLGALVGAVREVRVLGGQGGAGGDAGQHARPAARPLGPRRVPARRADRPTPRCGASAPLAAIRREHARLRPVLVVVLGDEHLHVLGRHAVGVDERLRDALHQAPLGVEVAWGLLDGHDRHA